MIAPRSFSLCAASVLALAASAVSQSVLSQGQILLGQGDPIPGVAGATNGGSGNLDNPILDLDGNVLFRGRFVGGGALATDDRGYFYGRTNGTLQLIVRSGQADPTGLLGAGTTLNTATGTGLGGNPRLSPTGGIIMFGCSMVGPSIVTTGTAATGANSTAILWGPPGGFTVLARRGLSVTTASNNQTYQLDTAFNAPSYQATALNAQGRACFQSTVIGGDVSGTTNNIGWLTGTPGNLDWVIRKGDIVNVLGGATPGQYPIGTLGFNCAMNANGFILHDERFSNTLGSPTPATTANDNVLLLYLPGGGNQLLVREGDPTAFTGVNYGSPTVSQGFGALNQCGFACTLTGTGVSTADDNSLWLANLSGTQLVHREGTPAPGLTNGELMGTANSSSSYSDYQGGSIAFYCTLTGPNVTVFNDTSLWLGRPGNLQLIAREGDPAPGFANNPGFVSATFGDTVTGQSGIVAGSAQMNERGQIVFSQVTVTVVDGAGTNAIGCTYCWDPVTGLKLFASAQDVYTLTGGPFTSFTAGGIQFPSGDGSPLDLNNNGDIVHQATVSLTTTTTAGVAVRARLGSLDATPAAISTATGGTQTLSLNAGVGNAGSLYIVAGTLAGTRPGLNLGGGLIVPLNFPIFTTSLGLLDAQGRGTSSFVVPAPIPAFVGATVSQAFGVIDGGGNIVHISQPSGLLLY